MIRYGFLLLSVALMGVTLFLVFLWVPTEANLGISQRIFYMHVPVAILGLASIILVAAVSAVHLITNDPRWDNLAYCSAELGAVLTSLAIITGAIWAKPVWGIWWTWDPKLTLTLILWFIYVSYLMLRAYGPKGSQGARFGAVVALLGAADAPIVYYAAELWRTTHPGILIGPVADPGSLDPRMATVLIISTLTLTALSIYLLIERYSLRKSEAITDELYRYVV